jgi:cardiolipin-specific phospholipase
MLSLFTSEATLIAKQLDQMRAAEASLMTMTSRFHNTNDYPHIDSPHHEIELINTEIPTDVIPFKKGIKCKTKVSSDETYLIHGIKVVSKIFQRGSQESSTTTSTSSSPLVLLHGYANGALFFYRNLLNLSNNGFNGTVYALDHLGWGLSSRPSFHLKDSHTDEDGNHTSDEIKIAESIFVESLEAWRRANNIPKMTLCGHSIGGYISVAYCEKYPQFVDKLILLSPAGVPDTENDILVRMKDYPLRYRIMYGLISHLFHKGYTPTSMIRSLPESRGRKLVNSYVDRRLPAITCPEEKKAFSEYMYLNISLPGSAENCLNKFLTPTAHGRRPTTHRISNLQVKDISFIYGQYDWMDVEGGITTQQKCEEMKEQAMMNSSINESNQIQNHIIPNITVYGVRDAGHLLMLENWEESNAAILMAGGYSNIPSSLPYPISFVESNQFQNSIFSKPKFSRRLSNKVSTK